MRPGDLRVWIPVDHVVNVHASRAGKTILVVRLFGPSGAPYDPLYTEYLIDGELLRDPTSWVERLSRPVDASA